MTDWKHVDRNQDELFHRCSVTSPFLMFGGDHRVQNCDYLGRFRCLSLHTLLLSGLYGSQYDLKFFSVIVEEITYRRTDESHVSKSSCLIPINVFPISHECPEHDLLQAEFKHPIAYQFDSNHRNSISHYHFPP